MMVQPLSVVVGTEIVARGCEEFAGVFCEFVATGAPNGWEAGFGMEVGALAPFLPAVPLLLLLPLPLLLEDPDALGPPPPPPPPAPPAPWFPEPPPPDAEPPPPPPPPVAGLELPPPPPPPL